MDEFLPGLLDGSVSNVARARNSERQANKSKSDSARIGARLRKSIWQCKFVCLLMSNPGGALHAGDRIPTQADRDLPQRGTSAALQNAAGSPYLRHPAQRQPDSGANRPELAEQSSPQQQTQKMQRQQRPEKRARHTLYEAPDKITSAPLSCEGRLFWASGAAPCVPYNGSRHLDAAVADQA